jgi:hypothetical protein
MSEKPKFDISKIKYIESTEIPTKASSKGLWQTWIPVLANLVKTETKAITITEKEASLPAVRNQIAKAIVSAKIEGIIINIRNINKTQTLFVSYRKPVKKQ